MVMVTQARRWPDQRQPTVAEAMLLLAQVRRETGQTRRSA